MSVLTSALHGQLTPFEIQCGRCEQQLYMKWLKDEVHDQRNSAECSVVVSFKSIQNSFARHVAVQQVEVHRVRRVEWLKRPRGEPDR